MDGIRADRAELSQRLVAIAASQCAAAGEADGTGTDDAKAIRIQRAGECPTKTFMGVQKYDECDDEVKFMLTQFVQWFNQLQNTKVEEAAVANQSPVTRYFRPQLAAPIQCPKDAVERKGNEAVKKVEHYDMAASSETNSTASLTPHTPVP